MKHLGKISSSYSKTPTLYFFRKFKNVSIFGFVVESYCESKLLSKSLDDVMED